MTDFTAFSAQAMRRIPGRHVTARMASRVQQTLHSMATINVACSQYALDTLREWRAPVPREWLRAIDTARFTPAARARRLADNGGGPVTIGYAGRLAGEKEATQAELDELRKQRDAQEQRLAAYRQLQDRFRALVDSGKLQIGFRNCQMVVKLPSSILFPSGSDQLSSAGQAALTEVTAILLDFKDRRFLIAGHTDNTATDKINIKLSLDRANAVREYLVNRGIDASRLVAKGYGSSRPKADNKTAAGRAINRRIEFYRLKK